MLDLVFPSLCPACESPCPYRRICESCVREIGFIEEAASCLKCGVPFHVAELPHSADAGALADWDSPADAGIQDAAATVDEEPGRGHYCGRCLQGEYSFDRARSVAYYDGPLRDMLHKFKYGGGLGLGGILSAILSKNFPKSLSGAELIVPVPLHRDKLRKREYNQSVILAHGLAKDLGVQVNPFVLSKIRETRPQFEITKESERRKNVKRAFFVVSPEVIKQKPVLLIDDVFTTGSTVDECARVLLKAGASRVEVLTLMRAHQR